MPDLTPRDDGPGPADGVGDSPHIRPVATQDSTLQEPQSSVETCRFRCGGEREVEGGPSIAILPCADVSPMRLDEGSVDRETHAHAVGLGREERLEQVVEIFRLDSLS